MLTTTLYLFFIVTPFLFFLQVITFKNYFVPIVYILLIISYMAAIFHRKYSSYTAQSDSKYQRFNYVIGYFLLINFAWVILNMLSGFYAFNWLRTLSFQVAPLFIIYLVMLLPINVNSFDHKISYIIIICSTIVAIEVSYEWYHYNYLGEGPTEYVIKFTKYVAEIGGGDVSRYLYNSEDMVLRVPGIMEHLHATGTYIGIGILTIFHRLYDNKGKIIYLLASLFIILFIILIIISARTAVIATIISILTYKWLNEKFTGRFEILSLKNVITFAIIILIIWYLRRINVLSNAIDQAYTEDFFWLTYGNKLSVLGMAVLEIRRVLSIMAANPITLIIGCGPGNHLKDLGYVGSDDFFLIGLFSYYGIIGFSVFIYAVWYFAKSILGFIMSNKVSSYGSKRILNYALCIVILLMTTTFHSGVLFRKQIYPFLFLSFGLGWRVILENKIASEFVVGKGLIRSKNYLKLM